MMRVNEKKEKDELKGEKQKLGERMRGIKGGGKRRKTGTRKGSGERGKGNANQRRGRKKRGKRGDE